MNGETLGTCWALYLLLWCPFVADMQVETPGLIVWAAVGLGLFFWAIASIPARGES
jgi:hypothetical protein